MRLANKNAIVTGAGSGIARAIALGFAREGARVVVGDIHGATARQTAEEIRAAGGEAIAIEVDVSRRAQVEAMLAAAIAAYTRIHILVCGPGISTTRNFLDLPEDEWDRVLDVNLKSVYLCAQAVALHMVEHGGGAVVNISSICEEVAQADAAHYIAAKGGMRMLTKAMALDMVGRGVRVNALAPGFTETALSGRFEHSEEGRAFLRRLVARIPMGRAAQPEEMVGAAVFLASDESSYVTGISLPVDGGYLAV